MSGTRAPLPLVGCGILRKEVEHLARKNGWALEPRFLDSSLHHHLGHLYAELDAAVAGGAADGGRPAVVYGACHPRIDHLLRRHGAVRTAGQNCVAMLLGQERFMAELSRGAYFLLEDWAEGWLPMVTRTFGPRQEVVREIFHSCHRLVLGLRTPCSADFSAAAAEVARFLDLPLEWLDVGLDTLQGLLATALEEARPRRAAR